MISPHLRGWLRRSAAILVAALWASGAWAQSAPTTWTRDQQETFLATAKIVASRPVSTGITGTIRVTLDDGTRRHDASVQRLDETKRVFKTREIREFGFRDTWKFNVAAYHVAQLLGLDAVPVTVERAYERAAASFTWWVDDVVMDEEARQAKNANDPDPARWEHQISTMRVFDQLIANIDRNKGNLLIDTEWRVWFIDHSRAFRRSRDLLAPDVLVRCERRFLEAMRTLDRPTLKARVGRWLEDTEIVTLLARRDKIVALFEAAPPSAIYTRGSARPAAAHSIVRRRPSSNGTTGTYPRSRAALAMSACESRTSPARGAEKIGVRLVPSSRCTSASRRFSDTRPLVARLITCPETSGATAARRTPSTTFAT